MRSFVRRVFAFLLHPYLPNFVAGWAVEIEFGPGEQEAKKMLLRMLVGRMDGQIYIRPLLPNLR